MKITIASLVAILSGLAVLVGLIYPLKGFEDIPQVLISWAVILTGIAALVGILNLVGVHWRKVFRQHNRDLYSPFLLAAFFLTLVAGLWLTPADPLFQRVVTAIQVPVESTLLALLSVTLLLASIRLFRMKKGLVFWSFIISSILFILFGAGMLVQFSPQSPLSDWMGWIQLFPLAGARGILIGVALGTLLTGLRILIGSDRPYGR